MSYICHIMNVVPHVKRQTAKCEAHAKPMRNPCEAKPCSQCKAGAPGPRDARDALANRCWASTSLDVSGCLWMSLDVSGCLWSCAVLSWMQHVRSARIHWCRRHFHFFHFFHFLPATRNLLPCCRYPASSLIARAVKPFRPPNQWWMRLKAITLTFPPAQTKLTLRWLRWEPAPHRWRGIVPAHHQDTNLALLSHLVTQFVSIAEILYHNWS